MSENIYDWLGSGVYFWEANPDRALAWAQNPNGSHTSAKSEPMVVGAVIDLGYCLDLISSNGLSAVGGAYKDFRAVMSASDSEMPINAGGDDHPWRQLDCAVINWLHSARARSNQQPFDSVRGVFVEGDPVYKNSGFRHKTHIQICVRNPEMIKGVFRVPEKHFSTA
jgi:hypothetical protein